MDFDKLRINLYKDLLYKKLIIRLLQLFETLAKT